MTFDELKKEKHDAYFIDSYDMAIFIGNNLGIECFEFDELNNDTCYKIDVTGAFSLELKDYDIQSIEKFKKQGYAPVWHLNTILKYFVNKNIIPKGLYIMESYW
jgi:hypothetical protein